MPKKQSYIEDKDYNADVAQFGPIGNASSRITP